MPALTARAMASSLSLGWREPSIPADELEAAVRSRAIRGVPKYVVSMGKVV
jgi:hypothetical protein